MHKNLLFVKYGLNHTSLKSLFIKFGISDFNFAFNNKVLEEKIKKYLDLNLDKKEILLKKKHLI